MKRISFKTTQVLCMGCLSLAIAASPSIQGTKAFAVSDSVSSSYSVNTLSVNNRPITNEPQPTLSSEVTGGFVLGIGAVLGIILLLVASSRSNSGQAGNSAHLARPSRRKNLDSADFWSTMQATNDLSSSNSTSSDCSNSTSNSSTSGDSGSTSWSGGDCSGGSSWGGDSGGGSWGGGDCSGGGGDSGSGS